MRKVVFKSILLISIVFSAFSCKRVDLSSDSLLGEDESGSGKIVLQIEGMTTEMGCAKLIEGKLINLEGVEDVSSEFLENKVYVTYDQEKLSKQVIQDKVETIANGLYKVTEISEFN